MSVGSVGSSILSADLSSFLKSSQSSSGVTPQSPDGEVTTRTKDGDLVTTIGQGQDANVVSVTSPSGTTVTEVGYVSPILVQKFLESLQQVLRADGASAGVDTSASTGGASAATTPGDATSTDDTTGVASSIQTLLNQLDTNGTSGSPISGLVTTFSNLLQNSGITTGSGTTTGNGARSALQAFLNNALSQLNPPDSSSPGSTVDAIA
jgi:hypothetical protein